MPMASLCGSGNGASVNAGVPIFSSCRSNSSLLSFESAVLDVRLWTCQRSAIHIQDSMHRLLILSKQQRIQQPAATPSHMKSTTKGRDKNAALLDFGLIAWWTFEDGPTTASEVRVEDITADKVDTAVKGDATQVRAAKNNNANKKSKKKMNSI
mmetsp:Transcript_33917/g.49267  ORF Transcript_33917/g.49267 Transcript_33917/m.49267 type:complete len:154 (-) Transcript_33917:517-978(-)